MVSEGHVGQQFGGKPCHSDDCDFNAHEEAAENWRDLNGGTWHHDLPRDYMHGSEWELEGPTYEKADAQIKADARALQDSGDYHYDGCPGCAARDGR